MQVHGSRPMNQRLFDQFSIVGGVVGGAGSYGPPGRAVNQTGNLLNVNPAETGHGAPNEVGMTHVGKIKKRRFGTTAEAGGHQYDFPQHPVRGPQENGQAYPQSKPGYLHGNGGGGNSGYGAGNRDAHFTPAADVTDAQGIAMRAAEQLPHFVKEDHYRYQDRTKLELLERMEIQAADYQRMKIKDLMNKGFSEEEIAAKLDRERQSAIDKATKQPMNKTALLEATIARTLPTQMNEDFAGTSVAPGLIPLRKDMSAYERATGQGNPVAQRKKFEAIRHMERLKAKMPDRVEPAIAKMPTTHKEMIQHVFRHAGDAHKVDLSHDIKKEQIHRDHQLAHASVEMRQHEAMKRAMVF